jgi:dolichol kinase
MFEGLHRWLTHIPHSGAWHPQRSGRREELLRGPLLYAAVHVAVTLLCWRHSPGGILALSVLCGGDGLAEVVGRGCSAAAAADAPPGQHATGRKGPRRSSWQRRLLQAGATPLPWNRGKTMAGSIACWLGGAAAALPLLAHFQRSSMFAAPGTALGGWHVLRGVLLCSAVGAAAESVPLGGAEAGLDNVTITVAVALCSRLCFGF